MMKKLFLILYLILGISSLPNAVTIDYTHTLKSDGTLTSSFAGALIETLIHQHGHGQAAISCPGHCPANMQHPITVCT
jgi:hypothetical protein